MQLIFKQNRKEIGEIAATKREDGNYEVSNVLVWPGHQRQGHGTEFYRNLYSRVQSEGKKLFVSNDRTDDAKALHQSMEQKGLLTPDGEIRFPVITKDAAKPNAG